MIGNSLKSAHKLEHIITQVDFLKESVDSLQSWIKDRRDRILVASLSNDFTNCVVCDSANGYKDTSSETSTTEAAKKISKGDILNVKAIRRAIYMA